MPRPLCDGSDSRCSAPGSMGLSDSSRQRSGLGGGQPEWEKKPSAHVEMAALELPEKEEVVPGQMVTMYSLPSPGWIGI